MRLLEIWEWNQTWMVEWNDIENNGFVIEMKAGEGEWRDMRQYVSRDTYGIYRSKNQLLDHGEII